ncbi:MAG: alcohol dehydrogenase catalytic domain-containing protein [Wenzhouxiangellaceae bacterium]
MVLERTGTIESDSEPLAPRDLPLPKPGAHEVHIRVHVCAVCHTELDQIEGRVATRLPRVPGHQVVGTIDDSGRDVDHNLLGQRVGVGWIGGACGQCKWCRRGEENLCTDFQATGCHLDGGYAEYMTIPAGFVHPIPESLSDAEAAPMLCAGAIGLRSLRMARLEDGQILGLTGFGASNHLVLSLARILYPESPVMVWARNPGQRHQALELGAQWAGNTHETPPEAPDAVIDTTPVWTTVLAALDKLAPGGRLVINAIAKESGDRDRLAGLDYETQLWREKEIKSVANVTRRDIAEYLEIAAENKLVPRVETVPLEQANEALRRIRFGDFRGAFVLTAPNYCINSRMQEPGE